MAPALAVSPKNRNRKREAALRLVMVESRQLRVSARRQSALLRAGKLIDALSEKRWRTSQAGPFSAARSLSFCGIEDSAIGERNSGALLRFSRRCNSPSRLSPREYRPPQAQVSRVVPASRDILEVVHGTYRECAARHLDRAWKHGPGRNVPWHAAGAAESRPVGRRIVDEVRCCRCSPRSP